MHFEKNEEDSLTINKDVLFSTKAARLKKAVKTKILSLNLYDRSWIKRVIKRR